jgi:predicted thioesterase
LSHVDNGESVGTGTEVTRQTVVDRIEGGSTYMTITKNSDGKWHKGAQVQIITVDSVKYIKTVADSTKKDNLGSLPRF